MKTFVTTQLSEQQAGGAVLDDEIKRGVEASEAGDKARAEAIFRHIVSTHPETLEAWIWLGWTSSTLESSEEAFKRASALDPRNEEAQLGLRWVESQRAPSKPLAQSEVTSGADTQASVEPPAPTSSLLPQGWTYEEAMRRAVAASRAGDKAQAYAMFRQVAERYPDMPAVWVWCGGTSPSLEDSETSFKLAQQLDPNNEEAALGLRWVALRRQVERQTAPKEARDGDAPASYPASTRTIANLTGAPVVPPFSAQEHPTESPMETPPEAESPPAKKMSAFARFLKKLNIPLPVVFLFIAAVVVWVVFAMVYLAGPTR